MKAVIILCYCIFLNSSFGAVDSETIKIEGQIIRLEQNKYTIKVKNKEYRFPREIIEAQIGSEESLNKKIELKVNLKELEHFLIK